jgi:CSLREA domain-containing protein
MINRTSYLLRSLTLLVLAALAACVLMAVVIAVPAQAATFTVNTAADEQNTNGEWCSLREAIINANQNDQSGSTDCPAGVGEDTINFDPSLSGQTITLGSQLPAVTDGAGLVIDGGSAKITVSGNNTVGVFEVGTSTISGAKLTLNNLTVANGRALLGAGILNNSSNTLKVNNSTLSGNTAYTEGQSGGVGGGIDNSGALTVRNSTISDNSASNAGGIFNNPSGTLTVSNSTVSGNSANFVGGIYNEGTLTVRNSTISNNTGFIETGGIYESGTNTTLKNTIVANNLGANNLPSGEDCSGTITNGGYNLDSGTSCGFTTQNNSLSSTDPILGPLADNGGPTKTHALLEGSPAIDKGNSFGATTDQRGVARPQGAAPDIGSFELEKPDTTAPTAKAPIHSFTTLSTLAATTVPVKLTWSATDNTGGSGIASYQLQQSINGGAYTNVALPSATATTISRSLAPGTNTYRYRVAAKDNAGTLSAWATGPSFKVRAFQESSSAIVDSGSWTTSALSGAYGGSVQSASALGRNATFTAPAGSKNVEWVSYRGNRGKAQVWLDGVQQDAKPSVTGIQPFDLYSSTVEARKVVFSKAVSPTTSHKLEVRVLGQKNGSSTSTRVDIDAFVTTS